MVRVFQAVYKPTGEDLTRITQAQTTQTTQPADRIAPGDHAFIGGGPEQMSPIRNIVRNEVMVQAADIGVDAGAELYDWASA